MANWASIVYGRTYEVDFRLLALPVDFTRSEQDWLVAHIQTMTRYPEELSSQPRWAVFRQHTLCVLLVACMARDLIGHLQPSDTDLTRDQRGRSLYTAVGYATRVSPGEPVQLPAYLDRDLRGLSSIYQEYVGGHWMVKSYMQDQATATEYQLLHLASPVLSVEADRSYFALNSTQPNIVIIWPDALDYRQALWAEAERLLITGQNVSLCLSLPTLKSAANGAFLNGTAFDVVQKEEISRVPEESLISGLTDEDQPVIIPKSFPSRRQIGIITLLLLAGSLFGGVTGLWIGNSLDVTTHPNEPKTDQDPLLETNQETREQSGKNLNLLLYGGLGTAVGSLLSLVVGMLLVKKLARSTSNDTSINRKQVELGNADQASTQRDPMFGFREKDQQGEEQNDNDMMTWG